MAKLHRRVPELSHPVPLRRQVRPAGSSRVLGLALASLLLGLSPASPAFAQPDAAGGAVDDQAEGGATDGGATGDGATDDGATDDEGAGRLERLAARLGAEDEARREAAFDALLALSEEDLPAIRARIGRLHLGRPPRRWAVDILNRFRRQGRSDVEGEPPDLVRGARRELGEAHRDQVRGWIARMAEVAVLWQALDRMDTLPAQREVFTLIALDDGLWMPEARNWVRRRESRLMAAVIEARQASRPDTRRWARWAMDELGADEPGRVIQALPEDQLPDVLRAYARVRVQSAMRVIVSLVDHRRRDIRRAARWAMEQYGGNAIWILRTAHRNEVGELPPRQWEWRRVAEAIYAHVDAERLAAVREAIEEGVAAHEAGELERMGEHFDAVLARVAEVERPVVLADGYAALGAEALERGELEAAARAYRRALRLVPEGDGADEWQGALGQIEARRLRRRGVLDAELLEADLELEGAPEPAAADRARRRWALLAALALTLLGLGLLWRRGAAEDSSLEATLEEPLDGLGAPPSDPLDPLDPLDDTLEGGPSPLALVEADITLAD